MKVLAIDVGGTNVKLLASGHEARRKFPSGPKMTAEDMVAEVRRVAADWKYDVVSIGYPGVVLDSRILSEPHNLGKGWAGFNFEKAFGCPVKGHQRCGHAGPRQLQGRTHAVSRSRHRSGLGDDHRWPAATHGTCASPLPQGHVRRLRWPARHRFAMARRNGASTSPMWWRSWRLRLNLTMSCWVAATRNFSRCFRRSAAPATTRMRSSEVFASGRA